MGNDRSAIHSQCDCAALGGHKGLGLHSGVIPDAAEKYPGEIARDIGLLALSLWLVVRPRSRLALDNVLFTPTPDHDPTTDDDEGSLDGAEEDLAQDR